ncbi:CBS domain-containing protein [Desulfosoma caldarium]|uniref:CBS domain protein n=1 Tax=Desulfosoma caldarium TaxID=610254 RepID=A0A3N1UHK1_9BACT|nr:CBS domain-containing protein [Desulfosoma caldarium]ROQ90745.1 CBS domain protein [Desulfosoma caldarium]
MKVQELMECKEHEIHSIEPEKTVAEAIDEMAAFHISALIVMEGGRPVGIFTERDVVKTHLKFRDKPFTAVRVRDSMTEKLIVARPDDDLHGVMSAMIQADIRHMPVMLEGRIVGVLSMRDIIRHYVGSLKAELNYLQDYIGRLEEAQHD